MVVVKPISCKPNQVLTEHFEIQNLPPGTKSVNIEPIKNQNQDYVLITSQTVPVFAQYQIKVEFKFKRPIGPTNKFLETLFVCEVAEKKVHEDSASSRNLYPKTFIPRSEIDDGSHNSENAGQSNAEKEPLPNHVSDQAIEKSPITENEQVCLFSIYELFCIVGSPI